LDRYLEEWMSEPFFRSAASPLTKMFVKKIDSVLKTKDSDNNYMFWPDKAFAHNAKSVSQILDSQNARNVLSLTKQTEF
jgi:hypothetical protein